jgi:mannonate dehydratase
VLGLPRIVSTADDVASIFAMVDSPANGLCFCTGSFGARSDNDLPAMAGKFADRIHALHLRNTRLEADGSFHEASHLTGSTNMAGVLRAFLKARVSDEPVAFRPDHGLVMMDDLAKPEGITPGYSCIGRMKGLAELRGMIHGLLS